VERFVDVTPGLRLRADDTDGPGAPVLLVADAGQSGLVWPDDLLARLATRHRVIRYDHRDTGRSTRSSDEPDYELDDLALDALRVLDTQGPERQGAGTQGFDARRAHVVGMGLGGLVAQLLLLDHPDRLLSATLLCCPALPGLPCELPGSDPAITRMLAEIDDPRDARAELAWRVAHRRLLHGTATPFDGLYFRAMEQRMIAHVGTDLPSVAHGHLDVPERGAELAAVTVSTLVVEAPEDPLYPPPHADHLAAALGGAPLATIAGMGHVLGPAQVAPVAEAILAHTGQGWSARR
jgi:pimeloyl-ACP methyl ester carboxylesterase